MFDDNGVPTHTVHGMHALHTCARTPSRRLVLIEVLRIHVLFHLYITVYLRMRRHRFYKSRYRCDWCPKQTDYCACYHGVHYGVCACAFALCEQAYRRCGTNTEGITRARFAHGIVYYTTTRFLIMMISGFFLSFLVYREKGERKTRRKTFY